MRLDKFLANSGIGTRSEVKKLIHSKLITVNGNLAKSDSTQIDENNDIICYKQNRVIYSKYIYVLLNKPKGYVSAVEDNAHPPVTDLINEYKYVNLFPVGRLDLDTTGTLLLTNDGELCHNMISPKKHVDKTYFVEVDGTIDESLIQKFKDGVMLDDEKTLPAKLEIVDSNHARLTIHQGKFHQVKRMFSIFGLKVINLDRESFAFLNCKNLSHGEYRILKKEEIELLNFYKNN